MFLVHRTLMFVHLLDDRVGDLRHAFHATFESL